MKGIFSLISAVAVVSVILVLSNCSQSATNTSTTNMSLSGTLGTRFIENSNATALDDFYPQALSDYVVNCYNPANDSFGSSTVSASGTFSVAINAAAGDPIGCFIVISSTGLPVATVTLVNTGSTGLDGATKTEASIIPSGSNVVMGTITFDPETGKAEIAKGSVNGVATAATGVSSSWTSVTGVWNVAACKKITANGTTACSSDREVDGARFLRGGGPPSSLYLHQMGPAVDGSAVNHYGLAVWASQSAYTACGSAEGVTLPGGWTTADTSITNALSFANFDTTYAAYTAKTFSDGKGACGYVPPTSSTTCASAVNTQSWGNGTITFSDADCKAMCAAGALRDGGSTVASVSGNSCHREWNVDWTKSGSATAQNQISNCTTSGCGSGGAANFVSIPSGDNNKPRNRFMVGELVTSGSAGSLLDKYSRTDSMCLHPKTGGSATSCTQIVCTVTENMTLKLKQESATVVYAEVEIITSAKGTNTTNTGICNDNVTYYDNWVAQRVANPEKFKMKLVAARE